MQPPQYLDRHVQSISTPHPVVAPKEYPRQWTIGKLSDEMLLNIFRYYLDASPRFWHRLIHICRKWRRIVSASKQVLHPQLFCTHGTPVLKTLDCWPILPIVIKYGGPSTPYLPTPEDEANIMAALKQSDRASSICLTVTNSLLEKLSAIEGPFSELEELVILCQDNVQLTLPSAFRWGERLRTLHLTRAVIPALPTLPSPSTGLVDLHLHKIPNVGYLSPEDFANALSRMTQLRSLSLHFLSFAFGRDPRGLPQELGELVVLPALTCLEYRGTSKYLDHLVARIDAPRLGDIDITFFSQPTIKASQLRRFINRIEMQKSHRRAEILFSEHVISISLTQPGTPTRLQLQVSCKLLPRQLLYMACICNGLSAFFLGVEYLCVCETRLANGQDDSGRAKWSDLIGSFTGVKWLHLAGNNSTNFMLALQHSDMRRGTVLPSLHKVFIKQLESRNGPLQEAIASFMHSRLLSGHTVGVEWINGLCGTGSTAFVQSPFLSRSNVLEEGPFSRQVTIKMLSDEVLLNIFHHYVHDSPKIWYTLTHVCQTWRQIVLASPRGLHLRLYCTHGTPVLKTLECWPPFPLVLNYGGSPILDPPALEDEGNIMAALKQSDRVHSITLTLTNSLLENIPTISEPLSELEELILLSRSCVMLTLPSAFRSAPRLRTLHLTRIAIPALPQLLSPSTGLVDLQLHEIPNVGYLPPDAFANAISQMTQLQTLSLHFLSLPSLRHYVGLPPPPGERVVLLALTCLKYRGTSKYLDSFVARIDAPRLGDIDITFFNQPTMDASQLGRFIKRIEIQTSLSRADVHISAHAISITFPNPSTSPPLRLQISCKRLDWQLSSMTQICDHFSPFLFRVDDLRISSTPSPNGEDGITDDRWLELILTFGSATIFHVDGVHVTDILRALCPSDRGPTTGITALPSLCGLVVPRDGPFLDAAQPFITSRRLSGCHVQLIRTGFDHAVAYIQRVKKRFSNDLDTYKQFLEALQNYKRSPNNAEILAKVEELFKDAPGLSSAFLDFIPGTDMQDHEGPSVLRGPDIRTGTPTGEHARARKRKQPAKPAAPAPSVPAKRRRKAVDRDKEKERDTGRTTGNRVRRSKRVKQNPTGHDVTSH